jgi:dienelactone hydrolase
MRRVLITACAAFALLAAGSARAEVKTQEVEYKQGTGTYQGFVAWDDAAKGKRPGVLVIHEWWGHNQHARNQALRLAKAGYVGFALDMYGKGKATTHPEDAKAMMNETMKDPAAVKARFEAALEQLKKDPHVDAKKIAVVGYCMGGAIALDMARAGEDINLVATFHAGLNPPAAPAKKGAVKARIVVNTGGADPFVPQAAVDALKKEMTEAGVKFEAISYAGAKHGFTNPDADKNKMDALSYNAEADTKSWENTMKVFKEVFGS